MKLSYRDIEPFVQKPNPAIRVILVYGPDHGLMKERVQQMAKTVVEDINDPFNVAVLSTEILADDPARLSDEANAISMMGGKRLIRVERATDKLTVTIKEYLENPNDNATIILESDGLSPRSSLRKLCEKEKLATAVPCYIEDERDLGRTIRAIMSENNASIDNDAVTWLCTNISGDRRKVRSELDKLITYKGANDRSPISLHETLQACGAAGATSIDTLIYAIGSGQSHVAMQTYHSLLEEGVAVIAILRAMQNHFRRLHQTHAHLMDGDNTEGAMKKLSPPIFFKQKNAFQNQINRWSVKKLNNALTRLSDLEAQSKTTGSTPEILCGQTILGLSLAA